MATRDQNAVTASDTALTELSQRLAAPVSPVLQDTAAPSIDAIAAGQGLAEVELSLDDLISDDNGEIVFFNDSGFRTLGIATDAAVVADGKAEPHVTATGADVTGFNFVTFNNGLTLYFAGDLDLIVQSAAT